MAKAKGKTKTGRLAQDLTTAQQVQLVLPEAARLRSQPTLLQDEWTATCMHPQQLTQAGGVAICPEHMVADVVAAVGTTNHATAILHSKPARDLGLVAYPSRKVTFNMYVPDAAEVIRVTRHLTQLSITGEVQQHVEGPLLSAGQTNHKLTVAFAEEFWASPITSSMVSGWLLERIPEATFDILA
eukprot:4118222-Amphidinium_carterae.1